MLVGPEAAPDSRRTIVPLSPSSVHKQCLQLEASRTSGCTKGERDTLCADCASLLFRLFTSDRCFAWLLPLEVLCC